MILADSFFATSNYLEAVLWIVVAAVCAVYAVIRRGVVRRDCVVAGITFALFGMSDVVEAQTGAWWRPWWLLVWKGLCLLVIAWLLVNYIRRRRAAL